MNDFEKGTFLIRNMDFQSQFSNKLVDLLIRHKYAIVSVVLSIFCLGSFFLYVVTVKNLESEMAAELHTLADNHFDKVQDKVTEALNVLRAIDAFYNSSVFVESDEFESFVSPFLVNKPGMRVAGFSPLVNEKERSDFLKSSRQNISPTFQIWSSTSRAERPGAGTDNQYLPITYIAPRPEDFEVLGFDINSDSEIRNKLKEAHSLDKIVVGNLLPAFSVIGSQLTITAYWPIVGHNHKTWEPHSMSEPLIGCTFGVFDIDKILMEQSHLLIPKGINLDIYQIADAGQTDLLSSFRAEDPRVSGLEALNLKLGHGLLYEYADTLDLSGRKWQFSYAPSPKFAMAYNVSKSIFVLVGGIIVGILLSLIVLMILNQIVRLREYARALDSSKNRLEEDAIKRQRIESALIESKRSIITLIGNLPGIVYRRKVDAKWCMEYVSDGCKETTGYDEEELTGSGTAAFGDLIVSEERPTVMRQARDYLKEYNSFLLVYRIKSKDGCIKWLWDRGQGVRDDNGGLVAVEGYISDITIQKEAEQKLQDAARLKSVGEAAATIIHDFKNPMQIILSSVEIIKSKSDALSTNIKYCDKIENQVRRIQSMSQEILDFSRDELVLHPSMTDLRELVRDMVDSTGAQHSGNSVTLTLTEESAAGISREFNLDRERIWRVIMNLVNNAREAMPSGGKIELKLAVFGDKAEISIKDDGPGIPEEIRETLFEPFVTKGKTNGTGLGLTIAKRIIKAHHGEISFVSQAGHGTTFFVALPRSFDLKDALPIQDATAQLRTALFQPVA